MLKIETINNFNKFLELEPVWNNLLSQSDADFPFLTFEWLTNWWLSYGKGSELLVLLAKEDSEIIGIAPLMITNINHRRLPVRAITFMANYHSNRSGFILLKNKKEAVNAVLEHLKDYRFDLLRLDLIENGSDTDTSMEDVLREHRAKYVKLKSNLSPYIRIEDTWENFLKKRSKNFRKNLRQVDNGFTRLEKYKILEYTNDDIGSAMNQIFDISMKTWKFATKTAIASDKGNINFYRSFADSAALNDWLNIYILRVADQPAAFDFSLRYKEKIYALKIGFDQQYNVLSPGTFLSFFSIRNSFKNRLKEYDLLGNNDADKTKWTPLIREHCKYFIFKDTAYSRALGFLEAGIIANVKKIGAARRLVKR